VTENSTAFPVQYSNEPETDPVQKFFGGSEFGKLKWDKSEQGSGTLTLA
jgi:hypothetical protein